MENAYWINVILIILIVYVATKLCNGKTRESFSDPNKVYDTLKDSLAAGKSFSQTKVQNNHIDPAVFHDAKKAYKSGQFSLESVKNSLH